MVVRRRALRAEREWLQVDVPITLNRRNNEACAKAAQTMQKWLDSTLSFAFDTQRVTCANAGGGGGGGGSRRRLLQQQTLSLTASTAGPGAAAIVRESLQSESPVYADLARALPGLVNADAVITDPPPTPPAADGSALPLRSICAAETTLCIPLETCT